MRSNPWIPRSAGEYQNGDVITASSNGSTILKILQWGLMGYGAYSLIRGTVGYIADVVERRRMTKLPVHDDWNPR